MKDGCGEGQLSLEALKREKDSAPTLCLLGPTNLAPTGLRPERHAMDLLSDPRGEETGALVQPAPCVTGVYPHYLPL